MKEAYEVAEMEIIEFETEDVILLPKINADILISENKAEILKIIKPNYFISDSSSYLRNYFQS